MRKPLLIGLLLLSTALPAPKAEARYHVIWDWVVSSQPVRGHLEIRQGDAAAQDEGRALTPAEAITAPLDPPPLQPAPETWIEWLVQWALGGEG